MNLGILFWEETKYCIFLNLIDFHLKTYRRQWSSSLCWCIVWRMFISSRTRCLRLWKTISVAAAVNSTYTQLNTTSKSTAHYSTLSIICLALAQMFVITAPGQEFVLIWTQLCATKSSRLCPYEHNISIWTSFNKNLCKTKQMIVNVL